MELCENSVYRHLKLNNLNFPLSDVKALLGSEFVDEYDPFKEYFKNLASWSIEDEDHINNLALYIKAKDQNRLNIHFKKALVRTVACAIEDSFFNKQALIFVDDTSDSKKSGQNMGKTSFCRFLCPPALQQYFTENPSVDKDGLISLSENFIINLDELAMMGRSEINQLKSFISKDKIKVRPPFGRKAKTMPRRASFVGSSNNKEFLTDETGSVRWLCFEISSIDWAYRENVDIDLCWSQAYNLYLSGYNYNLTAQEIQENEVENKKYYVSTPEIDLVQQYYVACSSDDAEAIFMTATDLIDDLCEKTGTRTRLSNVKMGKALKHLGFTHSQKSNGSYPVKGYFMKEINTKIQPKKEIDNQPPF